MRETKEKRTNGLRKPSSARIVKGEGRNIGDRMQGGNTHGNSISPARRAKVIIKRRGTSQNSVRENTVPNPLNTNAMACFVKETDGSVPTIGSRRKSVSAPPAMLASHVGMKSVQVATDQRRPPVLAGMMCTLCLDR